MPRLTEDRRSQQRQRILNAARLCYARQGFQATTMAMIIREAGLSAGAVYGYFSSKQDLGLAAMADEMARLSAVLQPVFDAPPPGGLRVAVAQILECITAISDGGETDFRRMAVLGVAEASRDPQMHAAMLGHLAPLLQRLEGLILHYGKVAAPARAAQSVLSLVLGLLVSRTLYGGPLELSQPGLSELGL